MPPRARSNPRSNPPRAGLTQGLRVDRDIMAFEFSPSVGILARNINKLGIDIRSFREPLQRAIREVMIPSIQKNFEVGGRPDWEPLSDVTLDIRAREGRGDKVLVRTGALKRNMSYMTMWDINEERAIIKDLPQRVWYGKLHQAGYGTMRAQISSEISKAAKRGERISSDEAGKRAMKSIDASLKAAMSSGTKVRRAASIPARPFVLIQPEDEDAIRRVFDDWMEERIREAGF